MTSAKSVTVSERFARSLLAAWNRGDLPRLRDELNQVAVADHSSLPVFEQERIEMVQEVAKTMRVWLGGARRKHTELNVALALLGHLATLEDVAC
jgi:hypothetical protein